MEALLQTKTETDAFYHFERPRLNQLFVDAMKCPVIMVCAGAGYGKTSAVHDFIREYRAAASWIQISERDNTGKLFWENYTHTIGLLDKPLASAILKLGFPDTPDKLNRYFALLHDYTEMTRRILIMDDFHLIEDSSILRFLENAFQNLLPGTSLFLISRSSPEINTARLVSKGRMTSISEEELRFTGSELAQYFRSQEISLQPESMHEIMEDTEGWAFAINLIARSYQKAPGYSGYLRSAMKQNIFQIIETEIWNNISERLRVFLVRLSLIDHLSIDLIGLLAENDRDLIAEMERQSSYVRRDSRINAYLIHNLFLEFLRQKQDLLGEDIRRETYRISADWCNKNGFKTDALSYYEKTGDYEDIMRIFLELPAQIPADIARYAEGIFDRAPDEVFDRVNFFPVMHIRTVMSLGMWEKASALASVWEEKYLRLPEDDAFRSYSLGGIYYCRGIMRMLMSTADDCYDFENYFTKLDNCLSVFTPEMCRLAGYPLGPWLSLAGSAREGAPAEYIDALARTVPHVANCFNGAMTGADDLARGELKYYQGDIRAAETFIVRALDNARAQRQFEVIQQALMYTLRIAFSGGDYGKAEKAMKDMQALLDENDYSNRFIAYDIALAFYNCVLDLPEKVPGWIKDNFYPYGHAHFIENFGNQAKVRYCYLTKNYPLLLTYMHGQKKRESILYGRIEALAMEACVHYRLKNRAEAFSALQAAYETAAPNGIIMPFIELGKDMRTLTASALKESALPDSAPAAAAIPAKWLETINRKSASYAKRHVHIIAEHRQANRMENEICFSPRETDILTDLSHGLSRSEIAASRNLSINTVKMVINMIYAKVGAGNLADLIRITVEKKMI